MGKRHKREGGFALLEAMMLIMVFLILLTSLFSAVGFKNRAAILRVNKVEAYHAAEAAVNLMTDEIMQGGDFPVGEMEKLETVISFELDDGGGDVSVPVIIWTEISEEELVLYAEAEVNGQKAEASVRFEKQMQVMSASSVRVSEWIPAGLYKERDKK